MFVYFLLDFFFNAHLKMILLLFLSFFLFFLLFKMNCRMNGTMAKNITTTKRDLSIGMEYLLFELSAFFL